jgi:hypothetical protein
MWMMGGKPALIRSRMEKDIFLWNASDMSDHWLSLCGGQ